jgi:hypothetical protein
MLILGFLLIVLRTELVLMSLLVTGIIFARRWVTRRPETSLPNLLLSSAPLAIGSALAALLIWSIFGHILPDTAVAKSYGFSLGPLHATAHVLLSSLILGCGALLLYLLSAWFYLHTTRTGANWAEWLCANAGFPLVIALACWRGQTVQGVRYILWTLVFSTAWNCLSLTQTPQRAPEIKRTRLLALALACIFVLLLPLDGRYAYRAMRGRAETFLWMRNAGLSRFHDRTMAAYDIGFIGYFTGAQVCDLAGLVNGRQFAALSGLQRAQFCARQNPGLLFISELQREELASTFDFSRWQQAAVVDFQNVSGNDRHILYLPKNK